MGKNRGKATGSKEPKENSQNQKSNSEQPEPTGKPDLKLHNPEQEPAKAQEPATEDQKKAQQQKAQQELQRKIANINFWRQFGIPVRHINFNIPDAGPWRDAGNLVSNQLPTGFLYILLGPRGTGKTQMGCCLIQTAVNKYKMSGLYCKVMDIFLQIRKSFKDKSDLAELDLIRQYLEPDLLVIDAMEVRAETPFEERILDYIIDKRYDALASTLLISNETEGKFKESVGPSIVSRIQETGGKIEFTHPSFRVKPKRAE